MTEKFTIYQERKNNIRYVCNMKKYKVSQIWHIKVPWELIFELEGCRMFTGCKEPNQDVYSFQCQRSLDAL